MDSIGELIGDYIPRQPIKEVYYYYYYNYYYYYCRQLHFLITY